MSNSVRPQRWQPNKLPRPWDSPGKNTGVGCHFLLQCMKVKSESDNSLNKICSVQYHWLSGYKSEQTLGDIKGQGSLVCCSPWGCKEWDITEWTTKMIFIYSVQFSYSVMSDSLQPHGLQHTRLPCPSPTLRAYSNSCPSSWWCHPTITSSVIPFSGEGNGKPLQYSCLENPMSSMKRQKDRVSIREAYT